MWGPVGLSEVSRRLPDEVRRACVDNQPQPNEWVPRRWFFDWIMAIYQGPAGERLDELDIFTRQGIDLAFGRVRRLLLKVADLPMLLGRADSLWSLDHAWGTLRAHSIGSREAQLELLHDLDEIPPVVEHFIFESLRHALSLARGAEGLRGEMSARKGILEMRLRW